MRKNREFSTKKSITHNTVSSVIGPQVKKPAGISVDAGTFHSNTKKNEGSSRT